MLNPFCRLREIIDCKQPAWLKEEYNVKLT